MDAEDSLTSEMRVSALLRRATIAGAGAYVLQRGDHDAGAVMVKVARLDGTACVLGPARAADGSRIYHPVGPSAAWVVSTPGTVEAHDAPPERDADAYLSKRRQSDPDLWIIEIEDRAGRHFLLEPIVMGQAAG
jgi:hypothetical protein